MKSYPHCQRNYLIKKKTSPLLWQCIITQNTRFSLREREASWSARLLACWTLKRKKTSIASLLWPSTPLRNYVGTRWICFRKKKITFQWHARIDSKQCPNNETPELTTFSNKNKSNIERSRRNKPIIKLKQNQRLNMISNRRNVFIHH